MKLNTKKTIFVGLAFLIICMFWQVYDNTIAKMLVNTFGLNQTMSGIVMALDNIFALVLLPLFGALSDKTKTKFGKRTPYIILGVILSSILFIGVASFDDLQNKSLEKQNIGIVETVDEKYLENTQVDLSIHKGEFAFIYEYSNDEVNKFYDLAQIEKDEIIKFFKLTDVDLSIEVFNKLCNTVLTATDLSKHSMVLALSHQERTSLDDNGARKYKVELEALSETLALRICESEQKEELLLQNGIKEFFDDKEIATQARSKVVWEYTRGNMGYLIGFLVILILVLIAMATYRTPAVSLMPDVTLKPLRSKANAIINLMGTFGGVVSLILMSFLAKDYQSYLLLYIVIGVLMIALLVVFLATVNEKKLVAEMEEESVQLGIEEEVSTDNPNEDMPKDVRKSFYLILISIIFWFMAYNAATTKFSLYAGDILNMGYTLPLLVANATAIVSYIPIGIIASKVGRKKTIIAGILILMLAFFLGAIATANTTFLIYFTMGIAGIGWATINVNSYPMIVEMSKGSNIGKYTGYYYTASMFAQIITPVFSGFIMDQLGTMRVLFPYSVVFCILALITMIQVKHGDSKPIAVKNIEAFDE